VVNRLGATLPPSRISFGVHTCDYNDSVTIDAIEKTVREPLWNERSAGFAVEDGERFWLRHHLIKR
jgi:hypothetical protein